MDYLSLIQRPFIQTRYNATTKSVDMSPLSDFWYSDPKSGKDTDPATLFRSVAWLYRGVGLRAEAVASMPFRITSANGETELDTSENYQNKLGWLPSPRRLFYLTEAALTCYGAAYWWRERNRVVTKSMRYMRPDTVTPQIDATGLTGFVRLANGERKEATPQDVVYFWQPDAWVELGPPESSPLMAAIAASGVLYNLNQFSAAYFKRGAIKATLLTVQGAPVAAERDRLKTWWRQMVSGVRNAWSAELVNADAVTPVVIGEGLKELSSAELTAEKRQDIATALGIPASVIFSESAGGLGGSGVVTQDEAHFYSKTIVPECELISEALNEQVLGPAGYHLEFLPQTLDVFQEDENQRAAAFASYVAAGLPIDLAAEMLGLELPPSWTYEMLRERREEREAQAKEQFGMETPPQEQEPQDEDEDEDENDRDAKALADLRKWRTKSAKRGKLAAFESDWIPATVVDDVKAHAVNGWRDALDGVIAVYEGEEPQPVPAKSADTTELVAALRSATEALLGDYDEAKGGAGSGNWGHRGRPGKRGGSAPGGGLTYIGTGGGSTVEERQNASYGVRENRELGRQGDIDTEGLTGAEMRGRLEGLAERHDAMRKEYDRLRDEADKVVKDKAWLDESYQRELDARIDTMNRAAALRDQETDPFLRKQAETSLEYAREDYWRSVSAYNDHMEPTWKKAAELRKQANDIQQQIYDEGRRVLETGTSGNATYTSKIRDAKDKTAAADAFDHFNRTAVPGLLPEKVQIVRTKDGRSFAVTGTNEIHMSKGADRGTYLHEMGHVVEYRNPGVLNAAIKFRDSRTQGETPRKLKDITKNSAYDDREVATPDRFVSPYVGKRYPGDRATEVVSMGIEHMYRDPRWFAKADPQHFDLTWDILRGRYGRNR